MEDPISSKKAYHRQGMTLEWQTASPPIKENFETIPEVVGDFYAYGELPSGEMPYRIPEPGVS